MDLDNERIARDMIATGRHLYSHVLALSNAFGAHSDCLLAIEVGIGMSILDLLGVPPEVTDDDGEIVGFSRQPYIERLFGDIYPAFEDAFTEEEEEAILAKKVNSFIKWVKSTL